MGNNELHVPNIVPCTQNAVKAASISTVAALAAHRQAAFPPCLD